LRQQWIKATDSAARKELAAAIQERAFEVVPYIPTRQWAGKTAYRKILKGLILGRRSSNGTWRRSDLSIFESP
jgi:peptide/nickel transport system substrate-binding protein